MKSHEPLSSNIPRSDRGVEQLNFTWEKATQRALKHQLVRSIALARCNLDYQIKYPNECRENPEHNVLKECHPEAKKRILTKHELLLKLAIVPPVDRPKRLNRVE